MKRSQAIEIMLNALNDDDVAMFTCGMISREAFLTKDRPSNFYLIGSMGLASSVALGLSLSCENMVFIFDGDGSALMDMGSLAMIASQSPKKLVHVILDNEAYQSTGCQKTISSKINFSLVAKELGYPSVYTVKDESELRKILPQIKSITGPVLILIKVELEGLADIGRISISPEELTNRLRDRINTK